MRNKKLIAVGMTPINRERKYIKVCLDWVGMMFLGCVIGFCVCLAAGVYNG